jgi:hypothetical protein
MVEPWRFADPPNTASITTVHVLERRRPILLVTHDADDGGWQFLCGTTTHPDDGRVIGLGTAVRLDPTVEELADLPLGWRAWRKAVTEPWQRAQSPDEE